ncbi:dihydropteroate synthase [Salinarchaeum laminariae]|uniref:dihydropteroate synthase n=1 Tax=Salinarchaeum laminariae TaxID=869888 RepID=UPI0020BE24D3|nr:dihydropteroate synthase [Salinarchaeum laminariae]
MRSVDAAGLGIGGDYPPRIMGVLNVSEESPYDPSVFDDPGEAAQYVDEELIGEGADVVDVGLESANKRYDVLTAEEELDRLDTAVEAMHSTSGDAIFSIETRYADVAEAAIERGFDVINDICGFADPAMPEIAEEYDVAVAKMASPPDIERPGAIDDTDWSERKSTDWFESSDYVDRVYEALTQNGLTDKTIVDPAFGGWSERKTLRHDRETFRRLREFRALGQPILVSINRKNFLRAIAGRSTEEALPVSLAATAMAIERGADVIRTHDVAETRDAALIADEFDEPAAGRVVEDDLTVEYVDVRTRREATRHVEAAGGDADLASAAVSDLLAIDGLDPTSRERLREHAEAVGAVVTGDRRTLVIGTRQVMVTLSGELDASGEFERLSSAIQSLPTLRENL